MRLFVFIPEDGGLQEAVEGFLASRPRLRRVEWSKLSGDRVQALVEQGASVVVLDPPDSPEELRRIDEACRRSGGAPRAVMFIPTAKGDAWRERIRPVFEHYHPSRRAYVFQRRHPKKVRSAMALAAKSESLLRWGALVPMTVVAIVAALLLFVFRDRLAQSAATRAGQAVFGAKMEIERLASTLTPSVEIYGVAVADRNEPMRNLFEFDRLAAGVSLGPLFSGKLHINEVALEGLRFGGERRESGALPDVPPPLPPPPPERSGPTFEEALEALLRKLEPPKVEDLEAVRFVHELEAEARRRSERLIAAIRNSRIAERAEAAKKKIEELGRIRLPAAAALTQDLQALRPTAADLLALETVPFEEEAKAIDEAKAAAEGVEKSLSEARGAVEKAKAMQKVEAKDLVRAVKLVEELRDSAKGLRRSGEKAEAAFKGLDRARKSLEAKLREADSRAKGAMERSSRAREILAGATGLQDRLAEARSELLAWRGEIAGKLGEAERHLREAREEAEMLRRMIEEDVVFAREAGGRMKRAIEENWAALQERYRLSHVDADELLRGALGDGIVDAIRWALLLRERVQPLLPKGRHGPGAAVVRRPGGTRFDFSAKEPAVWIRKASFSGRTVVEGEPFQIAGRAENLCSDISLIGEAARVAFELRGADSRVSAILTVPPGGTAAIELEAHGFAVRPGRIRTRYLTADTSGGTLSLRLRLELDRGVAAVGRLEVTGLRLSPDEAALDPRLSVLGDACRDIDGIAVDLEVRVGEGKLELGVRSDAAERLTKKLRAALAKQVEAAGREAAKRFDGLVEGPKRRVEASLHGIIEQAPARLEGIAVPLAGLPAHPAVELSAEDPADLVAGMRSEWDEFERKLALARGVREEEASSLERGLAGSAASLDAVRAPLAELIRELNAQIERLAKAAR